MLAAIEATRDDEPLFDPLYLARFTARTSALSFTYGDSDATRA